MLVLKVKVPMMFSWDVILQYALLRLLKSLKSLAFEFYFYLSEQIKKLKSKEMHTFQKMNTSVL